MKLLATIASHQAIRLPALTVAGFALLLAMTGSFNRVDTWFEVLFLTLATILYGLAMDTARVPFERVIGVLLGSAFGAALLWFAAGDVLIMLSVMHGDPTFRFVYVFSILIVTAFYFFWALIGRWNGRR